MKFLLLFCICFQLLLFGQNKPTFLGLNFNANWYELTNYQQLTYWMQDKGSEKKNTNSVPFVIVDFPHSYNKLDRDFYELNFDEHLVGFPKGKETELRTLGPEFLLSTKTYDSDEQFIQKSASDRKKMEMILNSRIGSKRILFDDKNVFAASWNDLNGIAILTCRFDDKQLVLLYVLQSSTLEVMLDKDGKIVFK
jgi:hypothetical protein